MTDMREDERERIGRLANEICGCSTLEQHRRDIALIEAEIDRRVAEEREKLLERLREPSEGMIEAGSEAANDGHCSIDADTGPWVRSAGIEAGWQAMLTAFQQENSDA